MPNMADIVVKKADGTTDVTYVALSPSAGDKTPAQWRVESIGTIAGNRPTLSLTAYASADKKARIVEGTVSFPETYTDTTTGIIAVRLRESFSFKQISRVDALDATTTEMRLQAANLIKSPLIQAALASGFAPS